MHAFDCLVGKTVESVWQTDDKYWLEVVTTDGDIFVFGRDNGHGAGELAILEEFTRP